jgi:hypothetical protein
MSLVFTVKLERGECLIMLSCFKTKARIKLARKVSTPPMKKTTLLSTLNVMTSFKTRRWRRDIEQNDTKHIWIQH